MYIISNQKFINNFKFINIVLYLFLIIPPKYSTPLF